MRIYPGDRAPRASRVGHNNGCRKNRSIRVLRPLWLMSSARISLILRMRLLVKVLLIIFVRNIRCIEAMLFLNLKYTSATLTPVDDRHLVSRTIENE